MAWASTPKVFLGCIAFVIWWLFAVFPEVRFLPIGRTAGSLLGAALMVVFQVISPNDAFAAVDLPILGLLFGTMVISIYLDRAGLFKYLEKALSWRTRGGMDFLCRLCLLAAVSSALFTNDTTCVVLTGFVLQLCREKKLRPKPFLIALACSSNIGSAATPIGNPQNLVIAVSSHISFGRFLAGVLPAVALGLVSNTLLLLAVYGRSLSLPSNDSTLSQLSAHPVLPVLRNSKIPSREAVNTLMLALWVRSLSLVPGASTPSQQTALPLVRNAEIPSREAGDRETDLCVIPSVENCDESDHGESRQERGSKRHSSEVYSVWPTTLGSFPATISTPEFRGHAGDAVDESVERQNNDGDIISTLEVGARAGNAGSGDQSMDRQKKNEDSLEPGVPCGRHGPEIMVISISSASSRAERRTELPLPGRMHKKRSLSEVCAPFREFWKKHLWKCAPSRKFWKKYIWKYLPSSKLWKRFVWKCGQLKKLWKKYLWKPSVYLVTIGMLAALLAGLSLPWTAITAAVVMIVMDLSDAGPSLDKIHGMAVSYALLVFFSGMFIATSGFNATGAPEEFWTAVEPHSRIDSASGVSVLSLVVTVLSNVASNVPTVILLGPRVATSAANAGASSDKAWLILAWVSTVAGNLTLVGSAANLIVCEQARPTLADKERREAHSNGLQGPDRPTYTLTFWNHLKFGFPSTLIVIAVGLLPLVIRKF